MGTRQSDDVNRPGVTPYFEQRDFPPPSATVRPVFGAHSQLRALAEVYACDDGKEKFVRVLSSMPCGRGPDRRL